MLILATGEPLSISVSVSGRVHRGHGEKRLTGGHFEARSLQVCHFWTMNILVGLILGSYFWISR